MSERQKWQYLTIFLEADAQREEDYLRERWEWKAGIPKYTPESLIPRLDALGDDGWELVHIEPVHKGNNADVLVQDAGSGQRTWSNAYFCLFKRPKLA
jgi:hypothetical protein